MFSCFHVTKLHESIRFHVFLLTFFPKNDVMVNGPLKPVLRSLSLGKIVVVGFMAGDQQARVNPTLVPLQATRSKAR